MKIILHYSTITNFRLLSLLISLIVSISFGQVRDPITGELATVKYDEKSGKYFLFGLDKMELYNGQSFMGKFIEASDSLVFFKSESDGGKLLEQGIASIEKLTLKNGIQIVKDNIINKDYITIVKQPKVQKKSILDRLISILPKIKFIY